MARGKPQQSEEKTDEPPTPPTEDEEKDDTLKDWTGEPEQPETDEAKSVHHVAKQVLAGEWGRGQERRVALANAGYDPNEVQQEVVRLLNE